MASERTAAQMFAAQNPHDYDPEVMSQRRIEFAEAEAKEAAANDNTNKRFWTKLIKIDEDKNDPDANALVRRLNDMMICC